jgi:hypothetical protein
MDWYMLQRRHMFREQYTSVRDAGESNLFRSPDESSIEGPFTDEARKSSVYTRAVELRPGMRRVVAAGMIAAVFTMIARRLSRRSREETEARPLPPGSLASSAQRR